MIGRSRLVARYTQAQGCQPGGGGGPPGPQPGGGGTPGPGPHGPPGGGSGPPRQSWQPFQSQLLPQPGSQNSPGHHCGKGPGCACASAATPTPARPRAAAPAMIVAAKRGIVFTDRTLPRQPQIETNRRQRFFLAISCQSGLLGVRATWVARTRIGQLIARITVATPVRPGPDGRGPTPVRPGGRDPSPGRGPTLGRDPSLRVPRANRGSGPNPSYHPNPGPRTLLGTIAGRGRAELAPRSRRPLRPGPKRRLWRIWLQQNVESFSHVSRTRRGFVENYRRQRFFLSVSCQSGRSAHGLRVLE
jgi:hypothetical protein